MESYTKRVNVEISLDAIRNNYRYVKSLIPEECKVCAVVKADAYGHGAVRVAKALAADGVEIFAVACISEALELRSAGIESDILILGRTEVSDCEQICRNNLIQTLYSYDYANELANELRNKGMKMRVHLKLDTGMNRIGFVCQSADDIQVTTAHIVNLSRLPLFEIEGIYSHFAVSDRRSDIYNAIQYRNFISVTKKLEKLGLNGLVKHICNSDGIMNFPYCHMDMVRAGICLYGVEGGPNLRAAMEVKSKVIHIHKVKAGESISYGCTYKATRDTDVATVCIGYADGLPRAWGEKGYMLINGKRAKILGRICMDQCIVDITNIECEVGDVVTIFGTDGLETLSAKKIAEALGTISYEIICNFARKRITYIEK